MSGYVSTSALNNAISSVVGFVSFALRRFDAVTATSLFSVRLSGVTAAGALRFAPTVLATSLIEENIYI
jgi:hypothetical protein